MAVETITARMETSQIDSVRSLQEWASKPADFRLLHWLKPVLDDKSIVDKSKVRQAAAVLEGWVANKTRREVFLSMLYYYESIYQLLKDDSILLTEPEKIKLTNCFDAIKTSNDTAGNNIEGIPQSTLRINITASCEADDEQFSSLMKKIFGFFPFTDGQRNNIEELKNTVENIKWLKSKI